jgi:post-segregation antitoxin (ccd killing protein)
VSDVISVRVKKGLKQRAEELGINIREVVEKALEKAIEEKEREELRELAKNIKELIKGVSEEEWAKAVRRSRDER